MPRIGFRVPIAAPSEVSMKQLSIWLACMTILVCASRPSLAQSARPSADPYPGSGGRFFGTPGWPASYKPEKFSSFRVGVTTKAQVVATLGKPEGWVTNPDGTSQLGYAYKVGTVSIGNRPA